MNRRLEALTSLRFFAALHVILFHALGDRTLGLPAPVEAVVRAGPVSVSFFFVLSGFILTIAYASRPPAAQWKKYARARFARIYPLYALGLLLMALGWWRTHAQSGWLGATLLTPLLLQAWVPTFATAWNPPAWSLSVEALFYAVFPALLPRVLRASKPKLMSLAVAGWVLGLGLALAYVAISPDGLHEITTASDAPWLNALKFFPLVRLPEFFVGLVLGRLALDGHRLPAWSGGVAVIVLLLALMVSPSLSFPLLHNGLLTPLFAVLIFSIGTSTPPKWLEHRWLVTLGEASYALYILQTPVLGVLHGIAKRGGLESPALFLVLGVLASVTVSLVCWRWVERPARKWLTERGARA